MLYVNFFYNIYQPYTACKDPSEAMMPAYAGWEY